MKVSPKLQKTKLLAEDVRQRLTSLSTDELALAVLWIDEKLRKEQDINDNDFAELCVAITRLQANIHLLNRAFYEMSAHLDSTMNKNNNEP